MPLYKERILEKHKDHTPLFSSTMTRSDEISITMSATEEDIRKLYDASKLGSIQNLNALLQDDPNLIQKHSMSSTSYNESPLHVSVSHGHLEFTRVLLDHSHELVVEVDAFQRTPLHVAATNGYLEIVKALLERNTSACLVRDQEGLIPLHYAVTNKQIEVIQELINARPQSVRMKLKSGQTILHLCVEGNHLEGLKLLTEIVANDDKDFLNTIDDAGNTILDLSFELKQPEIVGYLLSIPEVKTGKSITNVSMGRKNSIRRRKKISKKPSNKGQELLASSPTKHKRGSWMNSFKNKLEYKGDWAQEVQAIMMLVATVIATVTFQAGVTPPGGVWQQDTKVNLKFFDVGTAVMLYHNEGYYSNFLMFNTLSFMASVSVIMLIISRFPLNNRIGSTLLALSMFLAVFFLTFGYVFGIIMVGAHRSSDILILFYVWLGLVGLIGLWHIIVILVWVVKRLWRIFSSKCFNNITIPSTR